MHWGAKGYTMGSMWLTVTKLLFVVDSKYVIYVY